jgi:hypothetical protein
VPVKAVATSTRATVVATPTSTSIRATVAAMSLFR